VHNLPPEGCQSRLNIGWIHGSLDKTRGLSRFHTIAKGTFSQSATSTPSVTLAISRNETIVSKRSLPPIYRLDRSNIYS
jgi:hypothetical protein